MFLEAVTGQLTLLAVRNCSPVTEVTSTSPRSITLSDRDLNGKNGASYNFKNFATVLFIRFCVLIGASPYFHNIFAISQYLHPPDFCVKTNDWPFQIPKVSSSSLTSLVPLGLSPKSSVAFFRIALTSTNMLAPSSTGSRGLPYAFTVVLRPPM